MEPGYTSSLLGLSTQWQCSCILCQALRGAGAPSRGCTEWSPLLQFSPSFQCSAVGVQNLLGLQVGTRSEVWWRAGAMHPLSFLTPSRHCPPLTFPHAAPPLCRADSVSLTSFLNGLPSLLVLEPRTRTPCGLWPSSMADESGRS